MPSGSLNFLTSVKLIDKVMTSEEVALRDTDCRNDRVAALVLLVSGDAVIMNLEQSRWSACDQNLPAYLCQPSTHGCQMSPGAI